MEHRLGAPVRPPTVLVGVVAPHGRNGSWARGDADWSARLTLAAWRKPNGAVQQGELSLWRRMPEADVEEFREAVRDHDVVRVVADLDATPPAWTEVLDTAADDPELAAIALELQKPVVRDFDGLGELTLNRGLRSWWGTVSWGGQPVTLSLDELDGPALEQAASYARSLRAEADAFAARTLDAVHLHLDALARDWAGRRGPARLSKATLESVSIWADGSVELFLADAGVFAGHAIVVSGTVHDGLTKASIQG